MDNNNNNNTYQDEDLAEANKRGAEFSHQHTAQEEIALALAPQLE